MSNFARGECSMIKWAVKGALALAVALAVPSLASAKTITAVMHADLREPGMQTTAYIVRDFGYMIYDTLLDRKSTRLNSSH